MRAHTQKCCCEPVAFPLFPGLLCNPIGMGRADMPPNHIREFGKYRGRRFVEISQQFRRNGVEWAATIILAGGATIMMAGEEQSKAA